jgi:hypothetical protein
MSIYSVRFSLSISYEQFLAVYQGAARAVQVTADDGRSIRFPASALQPYLDHSGIHGRFEISFDQDNRLQSLRPVD